MSFLIILILLFVNPNPSKGIHQVCLSKIYIDNKVGFIDSIGQIIIEPKFNNALEFSEGLASARITGKYGYIDSEGNFVIEPKYDYAESFNNGTAVVYLEGTPGILNRDNSEKFFNNYKSISFFNNNLAFVKTKTDKMGVINSEGIIVVDTIYKIIYGFIDGLSVVEGFNVKVYNNTAEGNQTKGEFGVIDTAGKFIVPYNKYWEINDLKRSCFDVNWYSNDFKHFYLGFVNRKGEQIIHKRFNMFGETLEDNINDSTFVMSYFDSEKANGKMSTEFCYKGIVNSNGKIIKVDKKWKDLWPVNEKYSIVRQNKELDEVLVNSAGEIVFEDNYDGFKSTSNDSLLIVYKNFKSGVIDANGNIVIPVQDKLIYPENLGKEFFIFDDYDKERGFYKLGLADFKSNIIIPAGYYEFISPFLKNLLIQVFKHDTLIYFNRHGEKVWERNCFSENMYLNIDYMRRGDFYTTPKTEDSNSENSFRAITSEYKFPDNFLSLTINENDTVVYKKYFKGLNLYLSNSTGESMKFDSQDDRLYIKLQAKDENGDWKDIDYLPNSFCLNSYNKSRLEKKSFWTFCIPIFEGDLKTVMRSKFNYIDTHNNIDTLEIYSNEVECGINPGQFWRHKEYISGGIMDPYKD